MATRPYGFINGPETATLPTATIPSAPSDVLTLGYAQSNFGMKTQGNYGSGVSITAGGGITPSTSPSPYEETIFVKGSTTPVDITVDPQIAAGTIVGQRIRVIGTDATNTVKLENGTGLILFGTCTLGLYSNIVFEWIGAAWLEISRNGDV